MLGITDKKKKDKKKTKGNTFCWNIVLSAVMRSACVFKTGLLHDQKYTWFQHLYSDSLPGHIFIYSK